MKTKGKVFLLILLVLLLTVAAGIFYMFSQIKPVEKASDETVRIEIQKGESTYTIAQKLKDSGLIKNQKLFYYFVRYRLSN